MTDFSGLLRVEYCVANRALEVSNPGKFTICVNNKLLFAVSASAGHIHVPYEFIVSRVFSVQK